MIIQTQTARPRMAHLAAPPSAMAELRMKRINRAMAALTPAQREAFPSLSWPDRLYVIEHAAWPTGKLSLPMSDDEKHKRTGAIGGRKTRKRFISVAEIVAIIGDEEMTINAVQHRSNPRCGYEAASRALAAALEAGAVTARTCGNVTRYAVAPTSTAATPSQTR